MAYIKVKWRKNVSKGRELNAFDYEKYLLKDRGTELVFDANNCVGGIAIDQFESKQRSFDQYKPASRGGKINLAMEVIHNFNENESSILGAQKINEMGMEIAKRYFPEHQFLVVTHTDTKKIHNHILVNPVNENTGKRDITDKKEHLYNLRSVANDISKENSLSIIKENTIREQIVSEKVSKMYSRCGNSYKLDLFQKADFARSYATSFDEYVSVLHELSVGVAITNKKITYFYGDRIKGVRGDKLGHNYDKDGLISKFKENDQRYTKRPHLKERIYDEISIFSYSKRDDLGVSGAVLSDRGNQKVTGEKDYSSFTKSDRNHDRTPLPTNNQYDSLIPIADIKKASKGSILDYCIENKIPLKKSKNGDLILKQKDFVKIDDHSWTNLKNGTKGTLIEFAAFHEDISFLQSISKITGNKNLLLLKKHYGEVKRSYKSFYIPKQRQEEKTSSNLRVHNFLKSKGVNNQLADDLFKLNRVQTDKDGSIWLFSEKSDQAAIQYQFDHDKKDYKKVEHGKNATPFFESYKTGNNLRLFSNPLSFLRQKGAQAFDKSQKNELVLMGLEKKAMHIFLARHPNIKSIELIDSKESRDCPSHKSFYDSLKKDLHLFDIKIVRSNFEKSISNNLSHGIEI